MNVKKILCPVDHSDGSHIALNYAETIAKQSDAELHVISCYTDPIPYEPGFGAASGITPVNVEDEEEKLHAFVGEKEGVRYQYAVIEGSAESAIVEYADGKSIDLIVMGTHGRTGVSRLLMGSVAEQVLRHASCPVMTIRQNAKKLQESER